MSKYVDGFVIPVSKAKLENYRTMAEASGNKNMPFDLSSMSYGGFRSIVELDRREHVPAQG